MLCFFTETESKRSVITFMLYKPSTYMTRVSLNHSNFKYVSHDNPIDSAIVKAMR